MELLLFFPPFNAGGDLIVFALSSQETFPSSSTVCFSVSVDSAQYLINVITIRAHQRLRVSVQVRRNSEGNSGTKLELGQQQSSWDAVHLRRQKLGNKSEKYETEFAATFHT